MMSALFMRSIRHSAPVLLLTTALLLVFSSLPATAQENRSVNFSDGKWNPQEWVEVKSPRWENIGRWIQKADHIRNAVPETQHPEELCGTLAPQTYASMLWKEPLSRSFAVSSTMEFDHLMAPLIVLADSTGADRNGHPEYRQHWEVVLYNEGINVWHHEFTDKPSWHLSASIKLPFRPRTKYDLTVEVRYLDRAKGAELTIICGNIRFSYYEHDFPQTVRAGITGCEGVNRFYDFRIMPL